jgi:hypothetical protein
MNLADLNRIFGAMTGIGSRQAAQPALRAGEIQFPGDFAARFGRVT